MYINKNERGFTLLELMLTIAVLGIFLGIIYGFLNFNLTFLNSSNAEHDSYHKARIAMQKTVFMLRQYETLEFIDSSTVKGDGKDANKIDLNNLDFPTGVTGSFAEDRDENEKLIKVTINVDTPNGIFTQTTMLRSNRHYKP
jgi:prepilin-type N-terminal cleavage/methylation domain-containing protein